MYITLPVAIDPSNLNAGDPLFIDPDHGDLRLLPGSPMIDAGYPDTPDLPEFDIDGNPRVQGAAIDIGAHEYGFPQLNAAVLPYARAVEVNETATAFASIINNGFGDALDCSIAMPNGIPATFSYQTTDVSNALKGTADTPVDIPVGETQGFVFGITPTDPIQAQEIALLFDCENSTPAPNHAGLNTFILTATESLPPDLLAIGVTPSNDGVVRLPDTTGTGFFATAAVNIGAAGTVTARADDGGRGLPLNLQVCETTASGTTIICGNDLTRSVQVGQTIYYTVFVTGAGEPVAFDPAVNRLFLRFKANDVIVGATNVAVTVP